VQREEFQRTSIRKTHIGPQFKARTFKVWELLTVRAASAPTVLWPLPTANSEVFFLYHLSCFVVKNVSCPHAMPFFFTPFSFAEIELEFHLTYQERLADPTALPHGFSGIKTNLSFFYKQKTSKNPMIQKIHDKWRMNPSLWSISSGKRPPLNRFIIPYIP